MNKTTLAKKPKGSYDFATDGKNLVAYWLDCKVKACATIYVTCNPVSTAQRWSKSAKKRVDLPVPKPFEDYSKQKWEVLICSINLCSHIEFALGQRNGGGLSMHGP